MCLSLPSVMSVYCSLVVTCWERAGHLALWCVIFSCAFVTFPYVVLGQVWYLFESIPDLAFSLTLLHVYNNDADQPAYLCSLISPFVLCYLRPLNKSAKRKIIFSHISQPKKFAKNYG